MCEGEASEIKLETKKLKRPEEETENALNEQGSCRENFCYNFFVLFKMLKISGNGSRLLLRILCTYAMKIP